MTAKEQKKERDRLQREQEIIDREDRENSQFITDAQRSLRSTDESAEDEPRAPSDVKQEDHPTPIYSIYSLKPRSTPEEVVFHPAFCHAIWNKMMRQEDPVVQSIPYPPNHLC